MHMCMYVTSLHGTGSVCVCARARVYVCVCMSVCVLVCESRIMGNICAYTYIIIRIHT